MFTIKTRTAGLLIGASFGLALPAYAAGSVYAFGDSLADNGNIAHIFPGYTNGPGYDGAHFSNGPVFVEYLPALIHEAFVPGNDYAVGGAYAGTGNLVGSILPGTATEIAGFAAAGGRFSAQDTVILSTGPNDYFGVLKNATGPIDVAAQNVRVLTDLKADADSLIGLGAHQLVVLNVPDLGLTPSYHGDPTAAALAAGNNAALPSVLSPLSGHGVNVYEIDLARLLDETVADPQRFGLTNVTQACALTPSCLASPISVQDQTLFWDGVHPNTAVHALIARVIANELGAADAIGAQAQLALADAQGFQTRLIDRLQMPDDSRPLGHGPFSVFLEGDQSNGRFNGTGGQDAFGTDIVATEAGLELHLGAHALAGVAIGYSRDSAGASDLNGQADTVSLRTDAYHAGVFGAFERGGGFVDAAGGGTLFRDPQSSRPGLFAGEQLTGAPTGWAAGGTLAAGYRLHAGPIEYGPVGRLGYSHVALDSYTEQGEPVLTQHVGSQDADSLIGRAGLQASLPYGLPIGMLRPHVELDVAREFLDGSRTLSTDFTSVGIPLSNALPGYGGTYGFGSAGLSLALAHGGLVDLAYQSSFGRRDVVQRDIVLSGRIAF